MILIGGVDGETNQSGSRRMLEDSRIQTSLSVSELGAQIHAHTAQQARALMEANKNTDARI